MTEAEQKSGFKIQLKPCPYGRIMKGCQHFGENLPRYDNTMYIAKTGGDPTQVVYSLMIVRGCWYRRGYNGTTLQWRHNGHDSVSNHQPGDCLLNRLFNRRSKKTSKLRVTGLCAGNSSGTGEFPAQMASNAENVSIWWRHHEVAEIFPRGR